MLWVITRIVFALEVATGKRAADRVVSKSGSESRIRRGNDLRTLTRGINSLPGEDQSESLTLTFSPTRERFHELRLWFSTCGIYCFGSLKSNLAVSAVTKRFV